MLMLGPAVKEIVIQLSEQDYQHLLRCVRWVASDAVNDSNRAAAFSLAARIERAAREAGPAPQQSQPDDDAADLARYPGGRQKR